jgi:hypothetical protein
MALESLGMQGGVREDGRSHTVGALACTNALVCSTVARTSAVNERDDGRARRGSYEA